MNRTYQCEKCKKELEPSDTYEYRGVYSCEEHFQEVQDSRNFERQELIEENNHILAPLKGLNTSSDNVIGRANQKILAGQISIARKETGRQKYYNRNLKSNV